MLRCRCAILWVLTVHLLVHAAVAITPPACDCTRGEATIAVVEADACCAGCRDASAPEAPLDDDPSCPHDGSCPKPCCNGFVGAPAMLPTVGLTTFAAPARTVMHAPAADAPPSADRERLRRPPRSAEIV